MVQSVCSSRTSVAGLYFSCKTINYSQRCLGLQKAGDKNFMLDLVMGFVWKYFDFNRIFGPLYTEKLFLHGIASR